MDSTHFEVAKRFYDIYIDIFNPLFKKALISSKSIDSIEVGTLEWVDLDGLESILSQERKRLNHKRMVLQLSSDLSQHLPIWDYEFEEFSPENQYQNTLRTFGSELDKFLKVKFQYLAYRNLASDFGDRYHFYLDNYRCFLQPLEEIFKHHYGLLKEEFMSVSDVSGVSERQQESGSIDLSGNIYSELREKLKHHFSFLIGSDEKKPFSTEDFEKFIDVLTEFYVKKDYPKLSPKLNVKTSKKRIRKAFKILHDNKNEGSYSFDTPIKRSIKELGQFLVDNFVNHSNNIADDLSKQPSGDSESDRAYHKDLVVKMNF